jgi:hypothetical protein
MSFRFLGSLLKGPVPKFSDWLCLYQKPDFLSDFLSRWDKVIAGLLAIFTVEIVLFGSLTWPYVAQLCPVLIAICVLLWLRGKHLDRKARNPLRFILHQREASLKGNPFCEELQPNKAKRKTRP